MIPSAVGGALLRILPVNDTSPSDEDDEGARDHPA